MQTKILWSNWSYFIFINLKLCTAQFIRVNCCLSWVYKTSAVQRKKFQTLILSYNKRLDYKHSRVHRSRSRFLSETFQLETKSQRKNVLLLALIFWKWIISGKLSQMFVIEAIMTAEFVMAYLICGMRLRTLTILQPNLHVRARAVLLFTVHSLKTKHDIKSTIYLHLCGFISTEFDHGLGYFLVQLIIQLQK